MCVHKCVRPQSPVDGRHVDWWRAMAPEVEAHFAAGGGGDANEPPPLVNHDQQQAHRQNKRRKDGSHPTVRG